MSTDKANKLLSSLGLTIGNWNQITSLVEPSGSVPQNYAKYQAPNEARKLYVFAEHIAGWIPRGDWKIIQIDNSTSLDIIHAAPILRMLFSLEDMPNPKSINQASLLFEFGSDKGRNISTELLISNFIHLLLLFECHAQITSSAAGRGQFLSIQDGFVYFMAGTDKIQINAADLLKGFENNPARSPQWIGDITARSELN
jgi:hypothetical protein